jgi:hypothetical protein
MIDGEEATERENDLEPRSRRMKRPTGRITEVVRHSQLVIPWCGMSPWYDGAHPAQSRLGCRAPVW